MKVIQNEKLVRRNARIGQILTVVSLVVLGGGMLITFQKQEWLGVSVAALLVGFLLSQIGIYYTNRWGRRPRPDELLTHSLKGLDKRYALYHYTTPAAHLLIGPAGIWVLLPKHQKGKITFAKNRWKQSGGGILQGYLKLFAQEGIGRPDLEINSEIETIQRFVSKQAPDLAEKIPPIRGALVFTYPDIEIDAEEAPAPALPVKKLKEFMRQAAKTKPISLETAQQLQNLLGGVGEELPEESDQK
jgi:hypothetical protein